MNNKNVHKISVASRPWWALFFVVFLGVAWFAPFSARAASVQDVISFTDLQNYWARSQITRLATLDVVKGYPDHTYKPDQLVSRLETVVLVIRTGGFTTEAERLASGGGKTNKVRSVGSSTINLSSATSTPRVPWGQSYLDLAVEKGFLPLDKPDDFDADGSANRLEVTKLLARALYLIPPSLDKASAPTDKNALSGVGLASVKEFSDVTGLSPVDLACVRAVAAAGVMSGYPDGTFRPQDSLTRAEMAVVLSRLVDRGWVKIPAGRRLTGWIASVETKKGSREIALTSLSGVQKLKTAKVLECYQAGEEWPLDKAVNFRCEVILDGRRQASWVNLLEEKSGEAGLAKVRGSVKSVALGEDNLMVLSDMNCQDLILPLAWDAVVSAKKSNQGFKSLKSGNFVDVETVQGQVRKVTVLDVKTISGKVERLNGGCLYFKEGPSGNRPGWFNHYDMARVVDKDGVRRGDVLVGDTVQITYLDPLPGEIDDEVALEIKVTG